MEAHDIDPAKMASAEEIAEKDVFFRSILLVRNGYLVFERYYHGGGRDQRTELWSVTKSISSALVGIAVDRGDIAHVDRLMVDYLPDYPEFGNISIRQVLTHTTGLNWNENTLWDGWMDSGDWTRAALEKGTSSLPGKRFLYSSANSHFLSALIKAATGRSPGRFAVENLFEPLGIPFTPDLKRHTSWNDYMLPIPGTWRKDPSGLEIGGFGLRLTSREMAKLGFLFLNRGKWEDQVVISEDWIAASSRDHVSRRVNEGYGYQWWVVERAGQLTFTADGWGGQIICVVPALDMVIVLKCDARNPQGYREDHDYYRVITLAIESALN